MNQHFLTLGIEANVNLEQATLAYRKLVKLWHPDRCAAVGVSRHVAEERTKALNVAFAAVKTQLKSGTILAHGAAPIWHPADEVAEESRELKEARCKAAYRKERQRRREKRAEHIGVVLFAFTSLSSLGVLTLLFSPLL